MQTYKAFVQVTRRVPRKQCIGRFVQTRAHLDREFQQAEQHTTK